ncbi:hypothetical protein ILUMI_00292 [Ignelater luminosus]|uniref:Uncharacterized protein n=1 Tax=Ignelater luminosus TaxID=2038154 RepID=A0A8K0GIJ6_IGNLU|nr:hypothetical protein ILUMI_00292 [Ignelater luminosus]
MSKGRGIFRQPRQDYCIKDTPVPQKHFHYHGSKVKGNDQEKSKFIKYFPRISSAETPSNIQFWLEKNGLLEVGFNKKRIVALKEVSSKLNLGDKSIRIFKKLDIFKDNKNKKRSRKCLLRKSKNLVVTNKTSWIDLDGALQENMGEELCDEETETFQSCREGNDIIEETKSQHNQEYHKTDDTETSTCVKIISVDRGGGDLIYTNIKRIQSTTVINENPKKTSLSTIEILSARTDLTNDSFHSICTQTSAAQSQSGEDYNLKKSVSTLDVLKVSEQSSDTNENSKVIIRICTTKSGRINRSHSVAHENRTEKHQKSLQTTKPFSTIGILNESEIISKSFSRIYNQSLKDRSSKLKVQKDNQTIKIVAVKSSGTNTEPYEQTEPRFYENKEVQVEIEQPCEILNTDQPTPQKQLETITNLEADAESHNNERLKIVITPLQENSTKTDSDLNLNPLEKYHGSDKKIQTENSPKRKTIVVLKKYRTGMGTLI